jgi:CheY-like chemotaxis protein
LATEEREMIKILILVIEDEPDFSELLKMRLESNGFSVVAAMDGYQGIQLAHAEKPDLIILDLMLPAGDGASVLEKLKLSADTRHIPIVVLTGMINEEYKQKVIAKGVEAYLQKPCDSGVLLNTIKEILKK